MNVDDIDRRILRVFQHAPEISRRALARDVGLTQAVLNRRISRMEEAGIMRGKRARINWSAFGYDVIVFLRITLDKTAPNAWGEFLDKAKAIAEITVIETLVGRVDVRMDVMARDLAHYQEIYVEKILALPHLAEVETLLLISEVKNSSELPI